MKISIEQIEDAWSKDAQIDLTNIGEDSSKQLALHHKYHKILNYCKRELRRAQAEKVRLVALKSDYYQNNMPPQQLKELGWAPNKRIVLKSELDKVIESDEDIINKNIEIGLINDMVDFCESIIKAIYQKPFITRNIIENNKFLNGSI